MAGRLVIELARLRFCVGRGLASTLLGLGPGWGQAAAASRFSAASNASAACACTASGPGPGLAEVLACWRKL